MNKILAFDTSSEHLFICLKNDNLFYDFRGEEKFNHAEQLLVNIQSILEKARLNMSDLDLIVCASGPGSFTGLRIGMATAKGLAMGCGCQLVSVNTLDAWAILYKNENVPVLAVTDARKKKYYGAFYENGKPVSDYLDLEAVKLQEMAKKWEKIGVIGPHCKQFLGELQYIEPFITLEFQNTNPAKAFIESGLIQLKLRGHDADDSGPFYVRKSDAEIYSKGL